MNWSKYAGNNSHDRDQIFIQIVRLSYPMGTKYGCNDLKFLNDFSTQHDHFKGILQFPVIAGISGPYHD